MSDSKMVTGFVSIPSGTGVDPGFAALPQQTPTTEPIEATAERILRVTSQGFAEPTMSSFTGHESLESVLNLGYEDFVSWLAARVAAYQRAVADYATVAQVTLGTGKKTTVAEAEWSAVSATAGFTKAFPIEAPIALEVLKEKGFARYQGAPKANR